MRTDTLISLRIQYHLAAATLAALLHSHWRLHIQLCLDVLRPLSLEQRSIVLDIVRTKVQPANPSQTSKQWQLVLECVANNKWTVVNMTSERNYIAESADGEQLSTSEHTAQTDHLPYDHSASDDFYWSELLKEPDYNEFEKEWLATDEMGGTQIATDPVESDQVGWDVWHASTAILDTPTPFDPPTPLFAPPNDFCSTVIEQQRSQPQLQHEQVLPHHPRNSSPLSSSTTTAPMPSMTSHHSSPPSSSVRPKAKRRAPSKRVKQPIQPWESGCMEMIFNVSS